MLTLKGHLVGVGPINVMRMTTLRRLTTLTTTTHAQNVSKTAAHTQRAAGIVVRR
jgi:hypothetical protein